MRRLYFVLTAMPLLSAGAFAQDASLEQGWKQIYLEDFSGMIFRGTSKHSFCVEQAYQKAHEIRDDGGSYKPMIALKEAIQLAATTVDGKQVIIMCSPNGALAMYFKAPSSLQSVYQEVGNLGTPQNLAPAQPDSMGGAPPPAAAPPAAPAAPN